MNKIKTENIGGLPEDERNYFYKDLAYWKSILYSETLAIKNALRDLEIYIEKKTDPE